MIGFLRLKWNNIPQKLNTVIYWVVIWRLNFSHGVGNFLWTLSNAIATLILHKHIIRTGINSGLTLKYFPEYWQWGKYSSVTGCTLELSSPVCLQLRRNNTNSFVYSTQFPCERGFDYCSLKLWQEEVKFENEKNAGKRQFWGFSVKKSR